MAVMTMPEIQTAKKKLYEEKRYLEGCLNKETPDSIRTLLEREVDKRNKYIDEIEAAIRQKEREISEIKVQVPDEVII